MAAQSGTKMFTVDKFLGINESGDGDTELKMGEASKMENFTVTDSFNLKLRPGIKRVDFHTEREPATILNMWSGFFGTEELLIICDFFEGQDRIFIYTKDQNKNHVLKQKVTGVLGLTSEKNAYVSIFTFNGELYFNCVKKTVGYNGVFYEKTAYVPLVIAGASPSGGGTTLENINLLTPLRRENFSADGESVAYVLPSEAISVLSVDVDNSRHAPEEVGSYNAQTHTFTFKKAPAKGVGNVEFTYSADPIISEETRMQIVRCRLHEEYNGSTDTRLFVAGNGTNKCFYTGITYDGEATAMYFPAMNEVSVDMSNSPVTGLLRHYSKLLVFKADGTHSISYEPVTLTDGNTIAGFYLRPINREYGNEVMGQVQTVNNYPRTITKNAIYEWRITSSYYRDERYAKRISDAVQKSMSRADISRIVTCDDDYNKTYYAFLNDKEGTVLVNRYELNKEGIWCVYKSNLCKDVRYAMMCNGQMIFANSQEVFVFEESLTKDAAENQDGAPQKISALWESGFMSFGADFRRKYSSIVYVSVQPQFNSEIVITAQTDKRSDYMEKVIADSVFEWENASFPDWTFNTNDRPRIMRVRLKIKKFVYYKLIFKIEKEGAKGTILGFDQQIRYASMAK